MPKDVKCKNCGNLQKDWCEKVIDSPCTDMLRDCPHFRTKTNADRMVAMIQNGEVADLLNWWEEIFEDGVPGADYMRWWFTLPAMEDE